MVESEAGRVFVEVRIENLADVFDARHGRIEASRIRRVEVARARVLPEVIGLLMPMSLVTQLGLCPELERWMPRVFDADRFGSTPPIPHQAVRLSIRGRDCVVDVGAVADHLPVMIGLIPLDAMDWMIDREHRALIGNPEHGGREMYDIFAIEGHAGCPSGPT